MCHSRCEGAAGWARFGCHSALVVAGVGCNTRHCIWGVVCGVVGVLLHDVLILLLFNNKYIDIGYSYTVGVGVYFVVFVRFFGLGFGCWWCVLCFLAGKVNIVFYILGDVL